MAVCEVWPTVELLQGGGSRENVSRCLLYGPSYESNRYPPLSWEGVTTFKALPVRRGAPALPSSSEYRLKFGPNFFSLASSFFSHSSTTLVRGINRVSGAAPLC